MLVRSYIDQFDSKVQLKHEEMQCHSVRRMFSISNLTQLDQIGWERGTNTSVSSSLLCNFYSNTHTTRTPTHRGGGLQKTSVTLIAQHLSHLPPIAHRFHCCRGISSSSTNERKKEPARSQHEPSATRKKEPKFAPATSEGSSPSLLLHPVHRFVSINLKLGRKEEQGRKNVQFLGCLE
jgi:hypothetical protein